MLPIAVIGIVAAILIRRSKSKPKPAKQELDEYEEKYLARQGIKSTSRKPAKKKETSTFCENCGNPLKSTTKFCGGCGNQV
jgi:hypothetical protein